nr:tetratricopeptide repeat protein [uncultured Methanobrevibacter sp.]
MENGENINEYHKNALKLMKDLENGDYEEKYKIIDEISTSFVKAISFNPSNYKIYLDEANYYFMIREYKMSLMACNKAISLNENALDAWKIKGLILQKLGRTREALDCYSDAIVIFPKESSLWLEKSLIHFNKGNYEKALNNCNKALKLEPKNYFYYYHKGMIFGCMEKYSQASQSLKRSLELSQDIENPEVFRENCSRWIEEFDEMDKKHIAKTSPRITYNNGVRKIEGMRLDGKKRVRGSFPPIIFPSQKDFYMDPEE